MTSWYLGVDIGGHLFRGNRHVKNRKPTRELRVFGPSKHWTLDWVDPPLMRMFALQENIALSGLPQKWSPGVSLVAGKTHVKCYDGMNDYNIAKHVACLLPRGRA